MEEIILSREGYEGVEVYPISSFASFASFAGPNSDSQRRNASYKPPSTVMTCPVVLLRRLLTRTKYASA